MEVICNTEWRGFGCCSQGSGVVYWTTIYERFEKLYELYKEAKAMNEKVEFVCDAGREKDCVARAYEIILRNFEIELDDVYADILDFENDDYTYVVVRLEEGYIITWHRNYRTIEIRKKGFTTDVVLWKSNDGKLKVVLCKEGLDVNEFLTDIVTELMTRE